MSVIIPFLFRRSLVASKSFHIASSLGAVRAGDPAERTWHQCFRTVIRDRSWANCLWEFDLVQISWTISVQSLLPQGNSCSSFLTFLFCFFLRPIGRITINYRKKTGDEQLYSEDTHNWVRLQEVAVWEAQNGLCSTRPLQKNMHGIKDSRSVSVE